MCLTKQMRPEMDNKQAAELLEIADYLEAGITISEKEALFTAQAIRNLLTVPTAPPQTTYLFAQDGGQWIIGAPDQARAIKSRKRGYEFIRFLLQHPGQDIPAVKVYHLGQLQDIQTALIFEANERARSNITKQIWAAIGEIKNHAEEVGRYLEGRIATGNYSGYFPDPANSPQWIFEYSQNIHKIG
ncbi:MAG: hypothetical protein ABW088_12530 [Sedimenticola sp.]